jgi:hypothetical protein
MIWKGSLKEDDPAQQALASVTKLARLAGPFSYSQPDRLNPNHSPLQTTAIVPRATP